MTTISPILKPIGHLLAAEERVAVLKKDMETTHPEVLVSVCAWCQKEQGLPKSKNQTHGICAAHKAVMIAQLEQLKYMR